MQRDETIIKLWNTIPILYVEITVQITEKSKSILLKINMYWVLKSNKAMKQSLELIIIEKEYLMNIYLHLHLARETL